MMIRKIFSGWLEYGVVGEASPYYIYGQQLHVGDVLKIKRFVDGTDEFNLYTTIVVKTNDQYFLMGFGYDSLTDFAKMFSNSEFEFVKNHDEIENGDMELLQYNFNLKYENPTEVKFRTEPYSLKEMFKWGMISKFVYEKTLQKAFIDFESQKRFIEEHYGYQSWSFGEPHFKDICNQIVTKNLTKTEILTIILKSTKGNCRAIEAMEYINNRFELVK